MSNTRTSGGGAAAWAVWGEGGADPPRPHPRRHILDRWGALSAGLGELLGGGAGSRADSGACPGGQLWREGVGPLSDFPGQRGGAGVLAEAGGGRRRAVPRGAAGGRRDAGVLGDIRRQQTGRG